MKALTKLNLAVALATGMAFSASALTITPATVPQFTGNDNSNLSDAQIAAIVGEASLTTVYKQDQGVVGDEGDFASSYETTFSNTADDPSDALIDYISGPSITGNPNIYLYVKDGNHTPAFYIFDITGWNGTDDLDLEGFWPEDGAISHVSILTDGDGNNVPDAGGTLALLGIGVALLGLARRKIGTR
jgi:hypothetical protein